MGGWLAGVNKCNAFIKNIYNSSPCNSLVDLANCDSTEAGLGPARGRADETGGGAEWLPMGGVRGSEDGEGGQAQSGG